MQFNQWIFHFYIYFLYKGIANGCAEDALSLAETVASFGAIDLEEERYANALARVSKSSMKVRYSFSLLKLMQSIILGVGAGTLILVTWKTSTADFLTGILKNIPYDNIPYIEKNIPQGRCG